MWGFRKVVIPVKNYKYSTDPNDYKIEVVPAETLEDYLEECLVSTEEYLPFNHRKNSNKKPQKINARIRSKRNNGKPA
jgi:predicted ATP-dependent protease